MTEQTIFLVPFLFPVAVGVVMYGARLAQLETRLGKLAKINAKIDLLLKQAGLK